MTKPKLLILQNELSAYNVPVYNLIAEDYDLTLGFYQKDKSKEECHFSKKCFETRSFGPFVFVKGLRKYAKQFDIVCIVPDMHVVSYCLLPFLRTKYKVSNWSIGFRVSYVHPYVTSRKHVFADKVFQSILSHCDSTIFYMEKSKEFWRKTDLDMSKVFVAPNTTKVLPVEINENEKRDFLFVGTLYKGKGLDLLLEAYLKAVVEKNVQNELHIVGDGAERKYVESFISEHHLEGKVIMHGAIFDESILAEKFSKALLCISPTQGGLSVPKSMGYGVPFVTKYTAITGGEIYHITPDETGIFYQNDNELVDILADASLNPNKYIEMGKRAKAYYDRCASVRHMADGAIEAFDYALKQ